MPVQFSTVAHKGNFVMKIDIFKANLAPEYKIIDRKHQIIVFGISDPLETVLKISGDWKWGTLKWVDKVSKKGVFDPFLTCKSLDFGQKVIQTPAYMNTRSVFH